MTGRDDRRPPHCRPRRRWVLLEVALRVVLAVAVSLLLCWLALITVLAVVRPGSAMISQAVRLLPDVVRLTARLARDRTLDRSIRWRLGLLAGYLALPIDLVPDVIPVLGYADDVIMVIWVLRSVIRRAGPEAVRRHWPGTPDGLATLFALCGAGKQDLGSRDAGGGEWT